jgi:hypothetical protein
LAPSDIHKLSRNLTSIRTEWLAHNSTTSLHLLRHLDRLLRVILSRILSSDISDNLLKVTNTVPIIPLPTLVLKLVLVLPVRLTTTPLSNGNNMVNMVNIINMLNMVHRNIINMVRIPNMGHLSTIMVLPNKFISSQLLFHYLLRTTIQTMLRRTTINRPSMGHSSHHHSSSIRMVLLPNNHIKVHLNNNGKVHHNSITQEVGVAVVSITVVVVMKHL